MAHLDTLSAIPYGAVGDTCNFGKHQVKSESPWSIPCTIVHKDITKKLLYLYADKIIDFRAFDAKEPNNGDSDRKNYGNNQWRYSNLRQWLNNPNGAGSWYTAQHSADAPPSDSASVGNYNTQYQARPGFLFNFSPEERAMLKATTIVTNLPTKDGGSQNQTTEAVTLPSWNELGLQSGGETAEGEPFELYKGAQNSDRVCYAMQEAITNTDSTSKPSSTSNAWYYWLRSPYGSTSYDARRVNRDGGLGNDYAYFGHYGVRPLFIIPMATGVDVIDKFMVLPSPSTILFISPVRTLTGAAKKIAVALDFVVDGSFVKVEACNNGYDASPTWEDVTQYVSENSVFSLTNAGKSSGEWGLRVRVTVDKKDAPWISTRGIAMVVLDD